VATASAAEAEPSKVEPADSELGAAMPVAFGPESDLFGLLTLPPDGMLRNVGVVVCGPLGLENGFSYRPLRTLAGHLAESGFPVLRFDWPGCGDSGELPVPVTGPGVWRDAVHSAIERLIADTGVAEVALVGLRIGATFALLEAATNPSVSQIVLLEPYATGSAYLRELRAFERIAAQTIVFKPSALPEGSMEAGGFLLSGQEVEALRSIELGDEALWSRGPGRSLIVSTKTDRATESLAQALRDAKSEVTTVIDPDLPNLWAITTWSFAAPDLSRLVVDWLVAGSVDRHPRKSQVAVPSPSVRIGEYGVKEAAQTIETRRGRLFGVTCMPEQPGDEQGDWIVFLNAGQIRRIGPNRLATIWARKWAQANLPSVRFDLLGIGDSDGDARRDEAPDGDPLLPHHPDRLRDIRDVLEWLAERHGARRFVLVGLCSGATQAFEAGLADPRVRGVAMVNPGSLFVDNRIRRLVAWHEMRRRAARPASLSGYFGREGLAWAVNGAVKRTPVGARRAGRRVVWGKLRPDTLERLGRMRTSNTLVGAVFASGDESIGWLERIVGAEPASELERQGVIVAVVDGPDHTFRPLWSQEILTGFLDRFLASLELLPGSAGAEVAGASEGPR
jgi:pimeloyl-ACP methyl ester carboxylesterase